MIHITLYNARVSTTGVTLYNLNPDIHRSNSGEMGFRGRLRDMCRIVVKNARLWAGVGEFQHIRNGRKLPLLLYLGVTG